jgi:DNA-binding transcriptional ArsR family regulator
MSPSPTGLDTIIHAPVRLAIMSALVRGDELEFTALRDAVSTSDGNLSTHAAKLEKAGYIKIRKRFAKKRPQTLYRITATGQAAFLKYLDTLQSLLPSRDD